VNVALRSARAFGEFVAGRYASLVRTAFLLTGDRGHAEDPVQVALLRTFHAWGRLHAPESAEAYARTTMIRWHQGAVSALDGRGRLGRRTRP
jgi:DNA-directed RNA polymerase specialized sigma24 family protein